VRKRIAAIAALIALAACHRAKVPREQFLLRLDGPWTTPATLAGRQVRSAPATIVYFRDDQEYFELHFTVIEQNDDTLYVSSNLPHASAVGKWTQDGEQVSVTRERVSRPDVASFICKPLTFHISGYSVTGNAGGKGDGMYAPVTRLVAPDFQSYLKEARQSQLFCPGFQPKT
jgi:hypothetical protein